MSFKIFQNMIFGVIAFLTVSASLPLPAFPASEIIEETKTRVIIREHPKTGKPYVSIVSTDRAEPPDPFTGQRGRIIRPDYRMLDPKVKSGEIPYEGPVSNRTKVYIFAASLMTVGTVGGAVIWAAAPAATGAGASSGAGALLAGGTAVTAGSAATYSIAASSDPKKEDYSHTSQYRHSESQFPVGRQEIGAKNLVQDPFRQRRTRLRRAARPSGPQDDGVEKGSDPF